jgi:Tol biopolymer transport system component
VESPFPAYQGDEPYVFVSYSHEDAEIVYPEISWLKDQGFNIWYDEGISPGSEWHQDLANHIEGAALFMYFITPNSVSSAHCQREVHYAIDNDQQLLAIHLKETVVPSGINLSLSNIQAILKYQLSDLDYRIKLLKGTSDYLGRGIGRVTAPSAVVTGHSSMQLAGIAIVALLIGGLIVGLIMSSDQPSTIRSEKPLKKFKVTLASTEYVDSGQQIAVSGDGQQILFTDRNRDGQQVFLRDLKDLTVAPILGTAAPLGQGGAASFTLSPDSEWVVFNSPYDLTMKKVRLSGGTPITLTKVEVSPQRGLTWGRNGMIVITPASYPGLTEVSAQGGSAKPLTTPEKDESHSNPWFLPSGDNLLFTISNSAGHSPQIAHLSLSSGEIKVLLPGRAPRFTTSGHLLFIRENNMWAAAFDPVLGEVIGKAIPVIEGVGGSGLTVFYAVSQEGTLVYNAQKEHSGLQLVWVDRSGREDVLPIPQRNFLEPRLSPDGQQIAVGISGGISVNDQLADSDIWTYSLLKNSLSRLTFDQQGNFAPLWTHDGQRIIFSSNPDPDGPKNLYWKAADGSDKAVRLTTSESHQIPWSNDGDNLMIFECPPVSRRCQIGTLNITAEHQVSLLFENEFNELEPVVSPNGNWIAYSSNRTGQDEIWVHPYPDVNSNQWLVSDNGGDSPRWSNDGTELFYIGNQGLMAVPVSTGSTFDFGSAELLFDTQYYRTFILTGGVPYDIAPDGRFLMTKFGSKNDPGVIVVLNWFDELERLIPTKSAGLPTRK